MKKLSYTCSCCGKEHEEWPAITLDAPAFYYDLSEADKKALATLSSDFCVIIHPEQTDRFIRCTLTMQVNDHCQNLEYGLWVSLSEKSFNDYRENYNNENHEVSYFGWLSNRLPDYSDTTKIQSTVFTRTGNQRPEIVPHESFDHEFVRDYYNGISNKEAERRINQVIKSKSEVKSWWRKLLSNIYTILDHHDK